MKFILSLAWKNLSRYRRRTIITASAIAVGLGMYIMMDAWLLGADLETERNIINYEMGSAKILHEDYWEEADYLPLKYTIADPDLVMETLKSAGYDRTTKRMAFAGELFFREGSSLVKFIGIDPETDENVFQIKDTVLKDDIEGAKIKTAGGEYLKKGEPGIMIGEWLANDMGISVGDDITIRTRTKNEAHETIDLYVIGIFNSPNPILNAGTGFIPLDIVDQRMQMEGDVTEVVVLFPEWADLKKETLKISNILEQKEQNLVVMNWKEMAIEFTAMAQAKSSGTNMIMFLVILIALIGISNTMLMAVFERVKEIGMMRALGMKDAAIRWAFVLESAGIGLIGSVLGVAIGALLNFYMTNWGIDMTAMISEMGNIGYRISGVFKAAWNPATMITAFIAGIVISALVSLIPSTRALKMQITECLRNK